MERLVIIQRSSMYFVNLILVLGLAVSYLSGCVNVARLENLPSSADSIPFDDISRQAVRSDNVWNLQTDFEYYMELDAESFNRLHLALEQALISAGYEVVLSDQQHATVFGKRGLRWHEWSAVLGAYYRQHQNVVQVYFRSEITQDITGSWGSNRAREVADLLCAELPACLTPEESAQRKR